MSNSDGSTPAPRDPVGSGQHADAFALWVRTAAMVLVVSMPLVVTPWGPDAYNHVKVLVLYGLTIFMGIGWAAMYAVTGRPRWLGTTPEIAVWAFLLAALLSSWASVDVRLTFFGAPGRYEGLFAIWSYIVLYFVGVHFFGSHRGLRRLATVAGAAAMLAMAYGVMQVFIPPLFAGEAIIKQWYAGLGMPRPPSTLGSPVVFGGYLALLAPLLAALAAISAAPTRTIWMIGTFLAYAATVFTLTRAAWLGLAVGTGIFMIALGPLRSRHRMVFVGAFTAVAIAVAVLVTVVGTPEQFARRVSSSVAVDAGSLAQRLYIWDRTLALIGSRPLLGWGLETLREVFPYERASLIRYFGQRPVIIDKAHNDFLQMAVSIGLPGAAAYAALWILVAVAAVRTWRRTTGSGRILAAGWMAAFVAYLIQAQFSFSTVALAPIVWLLAGAAAGWEATTADDGNRGTREQGNAVNIEG